MITFTTQRLTMAKRKLKRYLSISLLIIIGWFLFNAFSIHKYSKNYHEDPSDVAIVLGAGTASGKISHVYEQRILHAINLLNKGKVRKILFTGGYGEGQQISDSRAAQNYAMQKGVFKSQILLEEESTITYSNIKNARNIMQENSLLSALVVSDPYHMKRSMAMCEKVGIDALPSPTPTTMYRSRMIKFKFLMKESFNLWGYQLYGQFRSTE